MRWGVVVPGETGEAASSTRFSSYALLKMIIQFKRIFYYGYKENFVVRNITFFLQKRYTIYSIAKNNF